MELCVKCIICENSTRPLDDFLQYKLDNGYDIPPQVCDECKKAIQYVKSIMKGEK